MNILFIERPVSGTNPFGIELGKVDGDNPDAEGYEMLEKYYIDPRDEQQTAYLETAKANADAIYEVDNITAKNNQFRIK